MSIEQNVTDGKLARAVFALIETERIEDVLSLLEGESADLWKNVVREDHFWKELSRLCLSKITAKLEVKKDKYAPLTEEEAIRFEESEVPDPFWKYYGERVWKIPVVVESGQTYLEYITNEHPWVTMVKRYMQSARYKRRLLDG